MSEDTKQALIAWGQIQALMGLAVEGLPDRNVADVATWIIEHDDPAALEADPLIKRVLEWVKAGDYASAAAAIRGTRAPQ